MRVVLHVQRRIEFDAIDERHAAVAAGRVDRALNEILYEVAGRYTMLGREMNVAAREGGVRILGHSFHLQPA